MTEINWADPAIWETPEVKAVLEERIAEAKRGLEANRNELLAEVKKYKGVDVERYRALETEAEEARRKAAEAEEEALRRSGDVDKVRETLSKKFGEELSAREKKIADLLGSIQKERVERVIAEEVSKAKGNGVILNRILKDYVKMVETPDGDFAMEVYDLDGSKMFDRDGSPARVEHLLNRLKSQAEYAVLFESSVVPGAGGKSVQNIDTQKNPFIGGLNGDVEGQMRVLKENPSLAQQLREAAKTK
jgi:hypothetical protein